MSGQSTKKVLFISHDAGRTGAPLLLLVLLRWLKDNSDLEFSILLRAGGPLVEDFRALAPTFIAGPGDALPLTENVQEQSSTVTAPRSTPQSLAERLLRKMRMRAALEPEPEPVDADEIANSFDPNSFSLIYSNTATNGRLLAHLSGFEIPVITHVHELEMGLFRFARASFPEVLDHTDYYIACAHAVKQNLVSHHGVPESRVVVIHGFSQYMTAAGASAPAEASDAGVAQELGLGSDYLLVGACGMADWRKGVDLFIQLANRVKLRGRLSGVHFVWMGQRGDELEWRQIQHDLFHTGLVESVHFIGEIEHPWEWFRALDVFVLTSREDPFPLVCLEAASASVPIVCFAQAGGEPEFVENDCGFVVPYLDIEEMARRVEELLLHDGLRQTLGDNAWRKVQQRYTVDVICRKILGVISARCS